MEVYCVAANRDRMGWIAACVAASPDGPFGLITPNTTGKYILSASVRNG